jgi:hypothetical protein
MEAFARKFRRPREAKKECRAGPPPNLKSSDEIVQNELN